MNAHWQQAWEDAEQRLRAWQQSWVPHRAKERPLRVGQLDAELLDEELVQLLLDPVFKALGTLNNAYRSKFEPEISLFVRLLLYKFSLWDRGATYGAKLQDLRYIYISSSINGKLAPSGLPVRNLAIHALSTLLVPYLFTRLRNHALSRAWPDTPSTDKRRKIWNTLTTLESLHSAAALLSFIVFLWNGRYRTVADRLCSLCLVPSRHFTIRQVSYEFMNRQMVWHAFTEFLLLSLPFLSSRTMRRKYNQAWHRIQNFSIHHLLPGSSSSSLITDEKKVRRGKYFHLPSSQCAICAQQANPVLANLPGAGDAFSYLTIPAVSIVADASQSSGIEESSGPPNHPITTPYLTTPCRHVYCYVCIADALIRATDDGQDGWECLRCAVLVTGCERVEAERADETASESWTSDIDVDDSLSDTYSMSSE